MLEHSISEVDVSIVVPVFKEESNILPFLARLLPVIGSISRQAEVIFALDPSPDKTEEVIMNFSNQDSRIKLIKMSRRFGQPAATMAGLA